MTISMQVLRILVADDHLLVRRGFKSLIQEHAGWNVCAEATTGREAVELAEKHRPDIAVLDMMMPELNGIDAARRIRHVSKRTEVLLLSVHYSDQLVREAIEVGVRGYVLKSDASRDLLIAIENLSGHTPFFTPRATEALLHGLNGTPLEGEVIGTDADRLSTREREVLQLIAEGKSSKEVADRLELAVKTAETHRSNLMRKLKIHNVSELVRYAVRNRIVEA